MSHADPSNSLEEVKKSLLMHGILLHSDMKFPNIVGIVAGETVHGSWWSHPKARLIFEVGGRLNRDKDILLAKLVSGKETYVHRNLWPYFVTVATSKQSWQLSGLSDLAGTLLNAVETRDELKTNDFACELNLDVKIIGDAARQLERQLLVYGHDIHTPTGYHAKLLRNWRRWAHTANFKPISMEVADSKRSLEACVDKINREFAASGTLPWRAVKNR